MRKVLLAMCFLGAANLFADSGDCFCSSIVFKDNSAYVKPDAIPVLKTLCDKYGILEAACDLIDFREDGSAWVQKSAVEAFYKYCTVGLTVTKPDTKKTSWMDDNTYWTDNARNIVWRH